jgi:Na+/proline symporter
MARIAAAVFLLLLMIFNLIYIAVGIGKFAEEFLPLPRWGATLIVFAAVGVCVTLAGFFGVILTDMLQTLLIAVGAVILTVMVFVQTSPADFLVKQEAGWKSLGLSWKLWPGYLQSTPESYHHFYLFGPIILAGFSWVVFRILAGPNVWDFQFFLTARSSRDAAMAGGMWTVGYTLRWVLGCAFLMLGITFLGSQAGFDAEKIMPLVLTNLPVGIRGLFLRRQGPFQAKLLDPTSDGPGCRSQSLRGFSQAVSLFYDQFASLYLELSVVPLPHNEHSFPVA